MDQTRWHEIGEDTDTKIRREAKERQQALITKNSIYQNARDEGRSLTEFEKGTLNSLCNSGSLSYHERDNP